MGFYGFGGNGEFGFRCVCMGFFKVGKWLLLSWLSFECLFRNFDYKYYLFGEWNVSYLIKIFWNKFYKFEFGVRDYMYNDLYNVVGGMMVLDEFVNVFEFWSYYVFLDKIWLNW